MDCDQLSNTAGNYSADVSSSAHGTHDEIVEALRQAEAKYRSIYENAVEGIFQTTPSGNYLSANPALREFTVTARQVS